MTKIIQIWAKTSLLKKIIAGAVFGLLFGVFMPQWKSIGLIGELFVNALKAIAPILVFTLVAFALANTGKDKKTNMGKIIFLYAFATLAAALIAVGASFLFPQTLILEATATELTPPDGIGAVFRELLLKIVDNPVNALATANYIGVLSWAVIFGFAFRSVSQHTKDLLGSLAEVSSKVVGWIINLAPFGIFGIVFSTIAENGLQALKDYSYLAAVLVGSMIFVALVVNPLIGFVVMRKNPYPLVLQCLRESGIPAFLTRSSAANIPVNIKLCEKLGLDPDTYSVSIPLGATINMGGAAITINTLTMAAVHTLGIPVDFWSALLLSVVASLSAAGASGVTGGSLFLIPVACGLFGIPNDLAMQVVAIGLIIGVIQDSCETALNSSTDVLFTAYAEKSVW